MSEKRNSFQVPHTTTISEEEVPPLGEPFQEEEQKPTEDSDSSSEDEDHPLQKLISPLITMFQLVIRYSYIATNIVMMVNFGWLMKTKCYLKLVDIFVSKKLQFNNEKYSQGEWSKLGWHDLFDVSNHIQGSFSS